MTLAALEIAGVRVDLELAQPGAALPPRYRPFAGAGGPPRWSIALRGPEGSDPAELVVPRHVVEVGGRWRLVGARTEPAWLDLASGRGEARSAAALDTLLRAAVGTVAVERGGLLLHAAALAVDGRAHLFPARSGSGKSTLASRGGHPLCDELAILLPGPGGFVAHATPWWNSRGGAAPLAAVYELAWGGEGVTGLSGTAFHRLLTNMILVLDTPDQRRRSLASAAAVAGAIPLARLTFRPDSDVDALLRAGPAR